jgi:hypothetical protein
MPLVRSAYAPGVSTSDNSAYRKLLNVEGQTFSKFQFQSIEVAAQERRKRVLELTV